VKKIEAIVRPERFEIIKDALSDLGYDGMSVSEVKGHGNYKGVSEVWRGKRYRVDILPKIKIELVIADKDCEKVIQTIVDEAKTGTVGDGRVFVFDVADAHRIRTGEKGDKIF
jgi:nitrogen regulatory protein P-II 1